MADPALEVPANTAEQPVTAPVDAGDQGAVEQANDAAGAPIAENSSKSANAKVRGPGKKFQKGISGNPGGRPKRSFVLQQKCRDLSETALATLEAIIKNPLEAASDRITASKLVLAYGHGRPLQPVEAAVKVPRPPTLGISFESGGPGLPRTTPLDVEAHIAALRRLPPDADFLPDETGVNTAPIPAPYALPERPQSAPEYIPAERAANPTAAMWERLGKTR